MIMLELGWTMSFGFYRIHRIVVEARLFLPKNSDDVAFTKRVEHLPPLWLSGFVARGLEHEEYISNACCTADFLQSNFNDLLVSVLKIPLGLKLF